MPFSSSYSRRRKSRVFRDVVTSKRHRLYLPEIRHHTCFGSRFGYLIAVCEPEITLFDPISRASVPLPLLPAQIRSGDFLCWTDEVVKAVLTASPADPDCFVVTRFKPDALAFAKPNGAVWSPIRFQNHHFDDFVFLDGRLYCLVCDGRVAVFDLSSSPLQPKSVLAPPPLPQHITQEHSHLVLIGSVLCIVVNYINAQDNQFAQIFKLDQTWTWRPIQSLGNLCLILQDDRILSVVDASEDDNLIPGCLYFPNLLSPDYYPPDFLRLGYRGHFFMDKHKYFHRCIYYPTIINRDETESEVGWAIRGSKAVNLIPDSESSDIYTRLYPSIRFRATVSVKVLIRFLLENMSKH